MSVVVDITTLTHGGDGLGRLDGKAVFVSGAIPGDQVRCQLVVEKKRYAKGRLLEVISPAPSRVQPPCEHFSECGGCDWQQLSYVDQCDWKERLFGENCQHQLEIDAAVVKPLVKSSQTLGYRSRVQFKCCVNSDGFQLGFYRRASHQVVAVKRCPVIDPRIEALISPLRELLTGSRFAQQVVQVDVAVGDVSAARVVFHCKGKEVTAFCQWLQQNSGGIADSLFVVDDRSQQLSKICGHEGLTIQVDDPELSLTYGVGGFAQINLQQNRRLVDWVLNEAQFCATDNVLDLYCGMGNFSLPIARRVHHVIGVEGYAPSIESAKTNAQVNHCTNTTFYSDKVERFIDKLVSQQKQIDVVVLDPPRAGAKGALEALVQLGPRTIVYVSCDQQTLLRDLVVLQQGGYQIESLQPFDMFPQTAHTEIAAVLRRVTSRQCEL